MRYLALALTLATLPLPALAHPVGIVSATLGERSSGFETIAECEQALVREDKRSQVPLAAKQDGGRGSLFNREHGNSSRCAMIDGEPLIIVTPNGS